MGLMNFRMVFLCNLLLLLLLNSLVFTAAAVVECRERRCGRTSPAVKFPFRIRGLQPAACGYPLPSFDLSCSSSGETLLQLPDSVTLSVKEIDYASQYIHVSFWAGCLPRMLPTLSLPSSPFQLPADELRIPSTVLRCTPAPRTSTWASLISCPNDPAGYQFFVTISDLSVGAPVLQSCTKMYDIAAALPFVGFDGTFRLKWSDPECGVCGAEGKYCRLTYPEMKNGRNTTECYDFPTKGSMKKKVITGVVFGLVFLIGAVILVLYRYKLYRIEKKYQAKVKKFLDDYKAFKPTRYLFADLVRITNRFEYELGKGAHGTVYKGKLSEKVNVAVKVLNDSKANGEEFINEVGTLVKIHHANIVRLIGFCADGFKRAVVYDYFPNDTLQKFISSPDSKNRFLGWKSLEHISIGVAKGIEYLHHGCDERILHFDIKPHNVLLDDNLNPKITDFGLAKLSSREQSLVSMTTARGTIGYMAPEVFSRNFGNVSYKSDVYSFGMLLLEMVSGRKCVDTESHAEDQIYFPEWIYNMLEQGEDLRFDIEEENDVKIAKKLAIVGLWCSQWNPVDRPSMRSALEMLEGEGDDLSTPPNPFITKSHSRTVVGGTTEGRPW
ncbi:unnamed protein product [Cuscuta epithymum]|uniref:Protein kinase domain-containing protein n=1 Tax=Cuscuta epithymum TaxID=186058 RepID=A0AAV0G2R3_9ASTE|nr:unnamed protein product [Cuscuta epithymum]